MTLPNLHVRFMKRTYEAKGQLLMKNLLSVRQLGA